jgi:hypothetical protein
MHHSSQTDVGFYSYGSTWDGWSDGVAVGGHIGFNWQFGSFLYGLGADASGSATSGRNSIHGTSGGGKCSGWRCSERAPVWRSIGPCSL